MPHFMIVLIPYINLLKPFLENKMSIFEEYGAFKIRLSCFVFACLLFFFSVFFFFFIYKDHRPDDGKYHFDTKELSLGGAQAHQVPPILSHGQKPRQTSRGRFKDGLRHETVHGRITIPGIFAR